MFNGKKPDRDLQGVEMLWNKVAGGLGFEPRLAESESAVLPLDDPPPFPDADQGDGLYSFAWILQSVPDLFILGVRLLFAVLAVPSHSWQAVAG
jgi:hypothetical protein